MPAEKFSTVSGLAAAMREDNIDTDIIFPARFLLITARKGLGNYAFHDRRFAADGSEVAGYVLNDPEFREAPVIVAGANFGSGSSREQAVTCLKAKGIPMVIAASFSQTYLRNAYNNGFLCIEVPELVNLLRDQFAKEISAKEKTLIPGDEIDIDFTTGVINWRGEKFAFPALGSVPQSLVIAEGVENLVAKRLGLQ